MTAALFANRKRGRKLEMSYKMINEELKIASCRLSDLTLKETELILKQWGAGTELGTLTMFFNSEDDVLVLNADDEMYESYLQIAESYLTGTYLLSAIL